MSEQKHTSGPWWSEQDKHGVARYWIRGDGHEQVFVASVGNGTNGEKSHKRSKANASLIAAAPELLEALEKCLAAIPQGATAHKWETEAADAARAAIAKATGGAS